MIPVVRPMPSILILASGACMAAVLGLLWAVAPLKADPSLKPQAWKSAGFEVPKDLRPAPAFESVDRTGTAVSLTQLKGKVVLLHFWATFCSSCRSEMEGLDRLQRDVGKDALQVVAISIDSLDFSVTRFLEQTNVRSICVARDRSPELRQSYGVDALPMTYVIDRKGRIRARVRGPMEWKGEATKRMLDLLIRESP